MTTQFVDEEFCERLTYADLSDGAAPVSVVGNVK
jgi:hypothetical protein